MPVRQLAVLVRMPFVLLSVILCLVNAEPLYPYKVDIKLNDFNQISVNWRADDSRKRVEFALECALESDVSWLAFGFSDHGDYVGSDVCLWNGARLNVGYCPSMA